MAMLRMPGGIGRRLTGSSVNPMRNMDRLSQPRLGVQRRLMPSVTPKRILGGLNTKLG